MKPFLLLFSLVGLLAGCQPEPVSLAVTDVSLGEPGSYEQVTGVRRQDWQGYLRALPAQWTKGPSRPWSTPALAKPPQQWRLYSDSLVRFAFPAEMTVTAKPYQDEDGTCSVNYCIRSEDAIFTIGVYRGRKAPDSGCFCGMTEYSPTRLWKGMVWEFRILDHGSIQRAVGHNGSRSCETGPMTHSRMRRSTYNQILLSIQLAGAPETMTSVLAHPSLENMDWLAPGMTPEEIVALLGPPTQLLPSEIRYIVNNPVRPTQEYCVLPLHGGRLAGNPKQWELRTAGPMPKQGTLGRFWWNYSQYPSDFVEAQEEEEELGGLFGPMAGPTFELNPSIAHAPSIALFEQMNADLAALIKTHPMDSEEVGRITDAIKFSRYLTPGPWMAQAIDDPNNTLENEEWYDSTPLPAMEQKDVDDMRKRMHLARTATIKDRSDAKEGEEEYGVQEYFQVMNPATRSFAELVIEALNHPHQAVILQGLTNARQAPYKQVTDACMVLLFHPCPEIRDASARLLPNTPRVQLLWMQSKEAANDAGRLKSAEGTMRKLQKQDAEKKAKTPSR